MSEKTDKMLEEIDSLTVVELSELVKGIEEKYGVTAAAVAAPAAGGAGEAAAEKSSFDVVLSDVGSSKINVIKVVREITGLGLVEAKGLADKGGNIKENVSADEANEIKAKLEEAGATVELV